MKIYCYTRIGNVADTIRNYLDKKYPGMYLVDKAPNNSGGVRITDNSTKQYVIYFPDSTEEKSMIREDISWNPQYKIDDIGRVFDTNGEHIGNVVIKPLKSTKPTKPRKERSYIKDKGKVVVPHSTTSSNVSYTDIPSILNKLNSKVGK